MTASSEQSPAAAGQPGPTAGPGDDPFPRSAAADRGVARGRWIGVASWAYAVFMLIVLALVRWVGEGWWGVTVLLFIPRWLLLGPIVLLAMASALARRPGQWVMQGAAAVLVAGPWMGLSLPLGRVGARPVPGPTFRLLCYNLGEGTLDVPALIRLIERERIDLISFQEGPRAIPQLETYFSRGWYRDSKGFVLSRYPIVAELPELIGRPSKLNRTNARLTRVRVRAPQAGEFIVASVHLPTIRPGLLRFLEWDVDGLEQQIDWWGGELGRVVGLLAETGPTPLLVAGDFNMPSDDSSMASLRSVLRFGFDEAGWGYGYTRPSDAPWFRIDHILATPHWTFNRCWVGPHLGSDHLPILAEVVLPAADRVR